MLYLQSHAKIILEITPAFVFQGDVTSNGPLNCSVRAAISLSTHHVATFGTFDSRCQRLRR